MELEEETTGFLIPNEKEFLTGFVSSIESFRESLDTVDDPSRKQYLCDDVLNYIQSCQFQPTLLDKILAQYVPILSRFLHCKDVLNSLLSSLVLYNFCRIRGHKIIRVLFPTEVQHLETLYTFLHNAQDLSWQTTYVNLLWLSQLLNIPFPLSSVEQSKNLQLRILELALSCLDKSGLEREAASLVLARLLSRQDCMHVLPNILQSSIDSWDSKNIFYRLGFLSSLAVILKVCQREDFLNYSSYVISFLRFVRASNSSYKSTALHKLLSKCYARFGLLLIPMSASSNWKYNPLISDSFHSLPQDTEMHVHSYLEEIIDFLLLSIEYNDTFVRWSAAKGLARIVERLPWYLAEQIIDAAVLLTLDNTFLNPIYNTVNISITCPDLWHGSMLFFARLANMRLLKYKTILHILPLVELGLSYEIRVGTRVSGQSIRDASCYFIWSLYRSYSRKDIEPVQLNLILSLLQTLLFDREVNIRRAATAALFEMVGRHGSVPDGLNLISFLNYSSVSDLSNCYGDYALKVAKNPHFRTCIYQKLLLNLHHFDYKIQNLANASLYKLFSIYHEEATVYLPFLKDRLSTGNADHAYGNFLAIGSIVRCLLDYDSSIIITEVSSLLNFGTYIPITKFSRSQKTKAFSGICRMIDSIFSSRYDFDKNLSDSAFVCLKNAISLREESITEDISNAFNSLVRHDPSGSYLIEVMSLYNFYSSPEEFSTSVSIIGKLPDVDLSHQEDIILYLKTAYCSKNISIELQSSIISAFQGLCPSVYEKSTSVKLNELVEFLVSISYNYRIDTRGDVGSWVRKQSLQVFRKMVTLDSRAQKLQKVCVISVLSFMVRQAFEKIDNLRLLALHCLEDSKEHPILKHDEGLRNIIDSSLKYETKLVEEDKIESPAIRFLNYTAFREDAFKGIVTFTGNGFGGGKITSYYKNYQRYVYQLKDFKNESCSDCGLSKQDIFELYIKFFSSKTEDSRLYYQIASSFTSLSLCGVFEKFISSKSVVRVAFLAQKRALKCTSTTGIIIILNLLRTFLVSKYDVLALYSLKYVSNLLAHSRENIRLQAADILFFAIQAKITTFIPEHIIEEFLTVDWFAPSYANIKFVKNFRQLIQSKIEQHEQSLKSINVSIQ
ncbi:tubulin specific chaperone cofactor D [Schizosaccharomyces cryophilus OY26]|uniref:Tubulin specific chaperone cofactor D n=1 Tax=Schizosaccharomyces cryophilus (strain OY26 / ATCC MYA-4695 / CBS 11777 / NBRC 106824 / NRRL Y48691) TaxID=653667 RepID=S9XA61_SCHCR|nr:tubulin specific chaperone cofactor D [Schizosaccharomyces cryophilus OY26]EPY50656.1 tubulin specific chaperone cofactor D [Schizosaccharomyces cryophilus OY26]